MFSNFSAFDKSVAACLGSHRKSARFQNGVTLARVLLSTFEFVVYSSFPHELSAPGKEPLADDDHPQHAVLGQEGQDRNPDSGYVRGALLVPAILPFPFWLLPSGLNPKQWNWCEMGSKPCSRQISSRSLRSFSLLNSMTFPVAMQIK
jgi:hypothetical protein